MTQTRRSSGRAPEGSECHQRHSAGRCALHLLAIPSSPPWGYGVAVHQEFERTVSGVDLGSNSFHMIVARLEGDGRVHVLDRLREPVRLAEGLNERRELTGKAAERALGALERFAQRLRGLPEQAVRAVGTNTLRQAKNGQAFLERAESALERPIEIISGHEEARLIYLGVAHSTSDDSGRHLVVDIGGGSTELVIGERFEALALHSLYMGCVSFTSRFFPHGVLQRDGFRRAELAAALEVSSLLEEFRGVGWQRVTGSSGTALAIHDVIRAQRWGEGITLDGLRKVKQALIEQGSVGKLSLRGLEPDRAAVFAAGVAILKGVFESLGIAQMQVSQGALREGLVYELLGRVDHEDVQERTIRTLAERYKVDTHQAARVGATACDLFEQARPSLEIDQAFGEQYLGWAARLHEIGLSIAYSGYQKHSAYLIEHGEMPGFSREQQLVLAAIVRTHRRKIAREPFAALSKQHKKPAFLLAVIFRLAVRLHRSRGANPVPTLRLQATKSDFTLTFPSGFLEEHALTRADLDEECEQLKSVGVSLNVR
ncbi:MAG TPA: guanosine-5'-triphosphate,3'-diphosphate pyrophosphatase [Polyangiaceae bacterium]|nr:guanosine-5'-triphosphate,3'-diphosphate pyrophosphatase [Polyangiaceae bacterium]